MYRSGEGGGGTSKQVTSFLQVICLLNALKIILSPPGLTTEKSGDFSFTENYRERRKMFSEVKIIFALERVI